ncbi:MULTISPECIES: sensor histidine kinase [unclassified Nocardioides]|uniref:sensor histidine kinase n=1 Tax=unclassified Nocardioides TaxID=2615069 RepID=UPI001E531D26|nr:MULTISPECIES: sensor domain-containing protein [unclassified Nocardioides]
MTQTVYPAEAMSTPTSVETAPAKRPSGVRRVLAESGYALSAFVLALPAFVLVVVDLALGVGLSVLVGGVLLIAVGTQVARGFARLERYRQRVMLARTAATPAYLCAPQGAGIWRRGMTALRDPQSWLDVVWCVVGLVTATLAFAVTLLWWAVALGGLSYWAWQVFLPAQDNGGLAELLGLGDGRLAESLLNLAIGAVAALTLPYAVRLVTLLHAGTARVLLSSRADLQAEVRRAADGRSAARAAEAASLRRLERDIHDGPQQRLVRLSMDLGRARRQLERDPEAVAGTIDGALEQARETVEELRRLSRGIAPPLLVDRGLQVALEDLAARSAVPVEATVQAPAQLSPHVETTAYFVASEALTNVAKHSAASGARLEVRTEDGALLVRVADDGAGGAHPAKGLGLAGLAQRVAAAEGRLEVDSPVGGPTVVTARIPLAAG